MYYTPETSTTITERQLNRMGISGANTAALSALGMYPLREVFPENIDSTFYTVTGTNPTRSDDGTSYILEYIQLELPLSLCRANLKDRVSAKRWKAEMGGVELSDATMLHTDVDTRARLQTAIDAAQITDTVNFKLNGAFTVMTLAELSTLRNAIATHVQACFSRERVLHEAIDAAKTVEALEELDVDEGWPGGETWEDGMPE